MIFCGWERLAAQLKLKTAVLNYSEQSHNMEIHSFFGLQTRGMSSACGGSKRLFLARKTARIEICWSFLLASTFTHSCVSHNEAWRGYTCVLSCPQEHTTRVRLSRVKAFWLSVSRNQWGHLRDSVTPRHCSNEQADALDRGKGH